MGRKSSVVVHTPRNVDLPPHVVMVRGSEEEDSYMENGENKPISHPRKRCLCLCAWLFGLIFLCIGVIVIVHYLFLDSGGKSNNKNILSVKDKQLLDSFEDIDISKICNYSHRTALTLEKKISASDYIFVGTVIYSKM